MIGVGIQFVSNYILQMWMCDAKSYTVSRIFKEIFIASFILFLT